MKETKDIQSLLQEVQNAYQNLEAENVRSKAKMADLETELRSMKDDRDQVTQTLKDTQGKLDRFYPDMQTLRDQLEHTEVEINTLSMEVAQKNRTIQQLEDRIQELTTSQEKSDSIERTFQKEPLGYYGV